MANGATTLLARLELLVPRRIASRSFLLYAAYTAALFVVFLVVTFPYDLIARRMVDQLNAQSGWQIDYRDASFVPWDGYRFHEVRLLAAPQGVEPWIQAREMSLRPSLEGFLGRGFSHASFRGEAYGGRFSGAVARDEGVTIELSWSELNLAAYPRLATLIEGKWAGRTSGSVHVVARDAPRSIDGDGKIGLHNAALTQARVSGFTVPDLHFAQGDCDFDLRGGRLEIRSLKLSGSEVDAELRGQLYLRAPLGESVVNATLTVKPVPGAPAGLDSLLTLLNRNQRPPSGVFSYSLYGMLSQVRVR